MIITLLIIGMEDTAEEMTIITHPKVARTIILATTTILMMIIAVVDTGDDMTMDMDVDMDATKPIN